MVQLAAGRERAVSCSPRSTTKCSSRSSRATSAAVRPRRPLQRRRRPEAGRRSSTGTGRCQAAGVHLARRATSSCSSTTTAKRECCSPPRMRPAYRPQGHRHHHPGEQHRTGGDRGAGQRDHQGPDADGAQQRAGGSRSTVAHGRDQGRSRPAQLSRGRSKQWGSPPQCMGDQDQRHLHHPPDTGPGQRRAAARAADAVLGAAHHGTPPPPCSSAASPPAVVGSPGFYTPASRGLHRLRSVRRADHADGPVIDGSVTVLIGGKPAAMRTGPRAPAAGASRPA